TLPFDEERIRAIATRVVGRTTDITATMTNHWILDGGEPARAGVAAITAPTLVLHGTEDPLFEIGHGEALAAEIPGARLVALPGVGHQMPPPQVWDVVITGILEHTAAAITSQ
ncbi:MAG: alpha/beta fold hydrolase, partial [Actinomycetia bacterium]|nr:alpha/beta fold hydrolase [Actinomycetes bacterium]